MKRVLLVLVKPPVFSASPELSIKIK